MYVCACTRVLTHMHTCAQVPEPIVCIKCHDLLCVCTHICLPACVCVRVPVHNSMCKDVTVYLVYMHVCACTCVLCSHACTCVCTDACVQQYALRCQKTTFGCCHTSKAGFPGSTQDSLLLRQALLQREPPHSPTLCFLCKCFLGSLGGHLCVAKVSRGRATGHMC